ncbi:DUF4282 domain-containing protein [Glaciimonas sp. PCH181]|uniref:DUF4282 domain-containing protein n=1 Tax=Glaciimonas sp. PCH181 TaxID=2133943 RepID=UPI000D3724F5|nr:DUF4282 domain-containing protein [Glaciimonas sp. PCH181]PUA19803.1 hypothetical protein C7W93_08270 [Glaciimonas sp. PCH181]
MTTKQTKITKLSYFLGFEQLIAPFLIKLIYWIGIVVIIVGGGVSIFTSGGFGRGLLALVALFFGLLIWRVISELWILAFSIFQRLGEIRDLLAGQKSVVEEKHEE